jgi:two-component system, sensor histidine kinase and response regulator
MSSVMSHTGLRVQRRGPGLWWMIGGAGAAVACLAGFLHANSGTPSSQVVGDFAILLSSLTAATSCALAARRRGKNARAWAFMALAVLIWSVGQALWTYFGLTLDHAYPFPSVADAGFLSYAIPATIALVSFPRPQASHVVFLRSLLDAAVIAGSVIYMSWATVLGAVYAADDQALLGHLTGVAYPVIDVLMASLVLVLTMRSAPEERLRWLCLGGGLLVLTFTDSVYVKLTFEGVTGVTGTPLAVGWIAAFLLMALAPLAPRPALGRTNRRLFTLALELLPYVPVLGAAVVSPGRLRQESDPFLLVTGVIVLLLVTVRQIVIIFQNVTLTRELESKVAQRTAQLEGLGAIVNSSADAIVGKTRDGVITSWNPGAERIYGYRAADAIGRHADFFIPAHLLKMESAVLAAACHAGLTSIYETERVRGDGSVVAVSMTMSPIRGDSGIHGVATIAQDITERRRAEADLLSAREAAVQSSRLKSEFLATMSHEIRTPMNGVVGLTALMLETDLDETQRQYAEGVKGAGEALLALINDILDFSKLEAGKVDLDPIPFDPRHLVDEVAALLAESAQGKRLELIAYCRPDVPALMVGDAGRIRQILLNLASNAVKFTDAGEVSIRVTVLEQGPGTAVLRFEVRDTGIGIEPADHARLFESFSQADASTTRRYGGTGLGLAICQRLTEAMDGEIGLTSTPGQGSTFWFSLPLPVSDAPPAAAGVSPDLLTGLRVLVVDDNATNRLVLESQLSGWRMNPEAVEDAPRALDRLRAAAAEGRPYDIAVLDMCMPDMDGLDLAREISADTACSSTRLIMLTSTMNIDRAALTAAGVREWLTKPVRSSEFYDRLMRIMAPAAPTPAAPTRVVPARVESVQPARPSRGRILVVEDNEVNQLVARSMIARLGYQVDVVSDGALAVAATAEVRYLAVLMDCHMPVMDGFEATRAIRVRGAGARYLPIIAMTAGALQEDRDRCLAAGMDDYLTKPVDMARLEEALLRWIPRPFPPGGDRQNDEQALDPARLATLRNLGPSEGQGLLPQAAEAFRQDIQPSLATLRRALENGHGAALEEAAHKLKGAAANIGATRASSLCQQLERRGRNPEPDDLDLLACLEAELEVVDKALQDELSVSP